MTNCPTCDGEGQLTVDGPDDPRAEGEPTLHIGCRHCFGLAIAACESCGGTGMTVATVVCADCAGSAEGRAA